MENSKKAFIIFLVCLAAMAGIALVLKAVRHGGAALYTQGIKAACSEDEALKQQAIENIKKAAEEGDASAALFLAELYAGGMPQGVEAVEPEAFKCLSEVVKPDGAEARKYLDRAAELDDAMETLDPDTAAKYAVLYSSSPFASNDSASEFKAADVAAKLLQTASKSRNSDFLLKLATLYEKKGEFAAALKLYEKAVAVAPDYVLCLRIGDLYLYGKGTGPDPQAAMQWYQRANELINKAGEQIEPAVKQHFLDVVSVRMDIADSKLKRSGGSAPVTIGYKLAGNGNHYIVMAIQEGAKAVKAGEVIRTEKDIKAVMAKDVKLLEDMPREKSGFASMNQGMEWVLQQWAATTLGADKYYVFRLAE